MEAVFCLHRVWACTAQGYDGRHVPPQRLLFRSPSSGQDSEDPGRGLCVIGGERPLKASGDMMPFRRVLWLQPEGGKAMQRGRGGVWMESVETGLWGGGRGLQAREGVLRG